MVSNTATATATYIDDTVRAETRYTYRIKAINGAGTSERSRWYHIDVPAAPEEQAAEPPDKPTGLEATASHDSVTLTWDNPGDDSITGYVILRRVRVNNTGGDFSVLVADTGTAATTYTDDTVATGLTYTYRIKAINEHGVSERSRWYHIDIPEALEPEEEQAAEPPAKPKGLSATASHDQVVLTWDDPNDDSITGYVILRRNRAAAAQGVFDDLAPDTGTASTTYTDDSVAAGTRYTYRVKAINEYEVSERSRWFHIDTLAAPERPDKPRGLSATATHDQMLRRDWDSSFGVIEEDTGSADATYTDTTVQSQRGYVYRVRAVNAHGASEGSDEASASTPAPPIVVRSSEGGETLWSATLTAGTATWDGETLVGYSVWNDGTGALSDTTFDAGGRTVTVQVLVAGSGAEQGLYLG